MRVARAFTKIGWDTRDYEEWRGVSTSSSVCSPRQGRRVIGTIEWA